jgi:hypothetical protein
VFSFLKDTRGMVSWTARDMAGTLNVSLAQANDALPVLEMQGYVKHSGKDEWITTIAGESVSDSVTPRYRKEAVQGALDELRSRIRELNDFLSERARVQAADVGVELEPRGKNMAPAPKQIFTRLRARSAMLQLHRLEKWMAERTHKRLI